MEVKKNDDLLDELKPLIKLIKWSNHIVNKDLMFRRCFSENWFSDTLSWLLDPNGSHGLGVKFGTDFLKIIAQKRTFEDQYKNKGSFLKVGKGVSGVAASAFKLSNASSIREFYLSRSTGNKSNKTQNFCDVVFLDLDVNDGLFVTIENKLFSFNHSDQLELYHDLIEEKFSRTKVREYVYLTVKGNSPSKIKDEKYLKSWVCLSWIDDIFSLLPEEKKDENIDISLLRSCLVWLRNLKGNNYLDSIEYLKKMLSAITILNLIEELDRLNEGKKGSWYFDRDKNILGHSSHPSKYLTINVLSNLTISIQGKKATNGLFDKIIIPFGIHPDQIFNLIEVAAREIFYGYFGDSVNLYLSKKKRVSNSKLNAEKEEIELMHLINKNYLEFKTIVSSLNFV